MDIQTVWGKYGNKVRNFLRSRVRNPEDAEDLLQEILIKTYQNLSSVKDPKSFQSWLFKIARNALTDYYRKSASTISEQQLPEMMAMRDESFDWEENIHQELSNCIKPFINSLPKIYRDALQEVELNGVSQKKLAEKLGISHSAIKSRVQRGREMLTKLFQTCCEYQLDSRGNIIDYKNKSSCC